jgi:hypothetical protein
VQVIRTRLAIIGPVLIDRRVIDLAQGRHEWNLPKDRLRPGPRSFDLDAALIAIWPTWHKGHLDLGRLEAIGRKVVDVGGFEIGTGV